MYDTTYGTDTTPVWIRFGEIPEDGQSKIHIGDEIAGVEPGISVWPCMQADNHYYPILPPNPTEATVLDFYHCIFGDSPVYLVTGKQHRIRGHVGEPCLFDVTIIKKLESYSDILRGYC